MHIEFITPKKKAKDGFVLTFNPLKITRVCIDDMLPGEKWREACRQCANFTYKDFRINGNGIRIQWNKTS